MTPNQQPPISSAGTGPRSATVSALGLVLAGSLVGLAGCGRSAPIDALSDLSGDPDVAGVSITSPDTVVETVPSAIGETTTTTFVPPPQVFYTIQPGDTLSVIASRYEVTIEALAQANGITDVNTIRPGQELVIPVDPVAVEVAVEPSPESTAPAQP